MDRLAATLAVGGGRHQGDHPFAAAGGRLHPVYGVDQPLGAGAEAAGALLDHLEIAAGVGGVDAQAVEPLAGQRQQLL